LFYKNEHAFWCSQPHIRQNQLLLLVQEVGLMNGKSKTESRDVGL